MAYKDIPSPSCSARKKICPLKEVELAHVKGFQQSETSPRSLGRTVWIYGLFSIGEVGAGGHQGLSALKTQVYGREASNFLWFLREGKILHESPASYKIGHDYQLPV